MEESVDRWLQDMALGFPSFNHPLDSINPFVADNVCETIHQSLSSESYNSNPSSFIPMANTGSSIKIEMPNKILKAESWSSCATEQNSICGPHTSSPSILSFGNPDSPCDQFPNGLELSTAPNGLKRNYEMVIQEQVTKKVKPLSNRLSCNQDHIIAERKRREKLSERFIALSAIIPDLKKMDKASVLGDAIKHMKQLQEKVKALEDEASKRKVESAVYVKKPQLSDANDGSSCDENFDASGESLPKIEVKVSDKRILMRIQCENRKGVLVKVLMEIEKLHLAIINVSVVPFTDSFLDVTIVAQMDEDSSMTLKDLVKKLSTACREFM